MFIKLNEILSSKGFQDCFININNIKSFRQCMGKKDTIMFFVDGSTQYFSNPPENIIELINSSIWRMTKVK